MARAKRIYKRTGETRICAYCSDEYYVYPSGLMTRKSCGKINCKSSVKRNKGKMVECKGCEIIFYQPRKMNGRALKIYHNAECRHNDLREHRNCHECDDSYIVRKKSGQIYCTNTCRIKATIGKNTGEYSRCLCCGISIYVVPSRREKNCYCSRKCFDIHKRTSILKECACGCASKFWTPPSTGKRYANGHWYKYATGENSPTWRGGISNAPYSFDFSESLKDAIRRRDGYKCYLCDARQSDSSRKFPVHHIDYNKSNSDPANLLTLCLVCHSKTNYKRHQWENRLKGDDIVRAMRRRIELGRNVLARAKA